MIGSIIELNREGDIDPKNVLKIDGKEIKGIQNVKIEFGVDNHVPIVTIQLMAGKIKGKIKTDKIKIKERQHG